MWQVGQKLPPGLFKSGGSCSYHALDAIEAPCTKDDDFGLHSNTTSLSTTDGCCLTECAREMRHKDLRCLDEAFQVVCNDYNLRAFAAGL